MDGEFNAKLEALISRRRLLKAGALTVTAIAASSVLSPAAALADEWVRVQALAPIRYKPRRRAPRLIPAGTNASPSLHMQGARPLSMYNPHTGESLNTVYWENGDYVPGALSEVNYFFRDFRANQVIDIDPHLLDLLYDIRTRLDTNHPFTLISGYRTAATNAWLASFKEGVARHSMHTQGQASDINLPGRQLSMVERVALALRGGGVGYYPHSDFVHVDTGRVRHWWLR
ncbi:MAG: YcbK family protein [Candidatus Binataceae bacterium]